MDALLGTGFEGAPREPVAAAIAAINAQPAPVVACDVPSGVDASTGEVEGEAVRAAVTATFHGSKVGLHVEPGKSHAGRRGGDRASASRAARPQPGRAGLISERVLDLYPRRPRSGSKFDSGVVVVAGGSAGLTGAPTMAARSAQRAGAGLRAGGGAGGGPAGGGAAPARADDAGPARRRTGRTRPTGWRSCARWPSAPERVVLGPGLGRSDGAVEFARLAAREVEAPLLVDADGLNAHAGRLELFRERTGPTVLTPHAAELGRLLELEPEDVERAAARERAARGRAQRRGGAAEGRRHDRRARPAARWR